MINNSTRALKCIFSAMIILTIMAATDSNSYETEVRGQALQELFKLIPQDIVDKCRARRLKDMTRLMQGINYADSLALDTSGLSFQYLHRINDARYLHIYNKSYILLIAGCGDNLALMLMDSAGNQDIIYRMQPDIKLHSGYFFDLIYPFADINGDSIPEMQMSFNWGGIGGEIRFLSVLPDSLYFLKTENGQNSFGLMRGQLKLIDIDNDGIMEVYTQDYDIYENKEDCNLYKWNGQKYILLNNDCLEKK